MPERKQWNQTSGPIARRTNTAINALIEWAYKTDHDKITRQNIEDAITHHTPIEGEDTINQYVKRVVDHGPFTGSRGVWEIDWEKAR